jgi:putative transposase
MDFISDSMVGNRKFRTFKVMDDCSREALAIEVDTSLSAHRITRALEKIIDQRGKPTSVRTDNGPDFTSSAFDQWCSQRQIKIQFVQPGKSMQNGYIEWFNRLYREAVLDAYLFFDLDQVRHLKAEWMEEYTYEDPISPLTI